MQYVETYRRVIKHSYEANTTINSVTECLNVVSPCVEAPGSLKMRVVFVLLCRQILESCYHHCFSPGCNAALGGC